MTLREELNSIREKTETRVPADAIEVMHRTTRALVDSGLAEQALGVGDQAPLFALPNGDGKIVELHNLLAAGPVVLSFYRGKW